MRRSQVRVGDLTFDVREQGPVDGEPVILLHGFPETSHEWRHQQEALAAAGYRTIAPDQRGYSPGARPAAVEDYRLDLLVDDVLGLADVTAVRTVDESMDIDRLAYPAIIVSASGMATGGRVLHHLRRYLPDHRNTVILVGFQAAQTRGRLLAEGARQVKLLGHYIPVRAEVVDLPSFSVHADADELLAWLGTAIAPPEAAYVVHGEPAASAALADTAGERLGWNVVVPSYGELVRID